MIDVASYMSNTFRKMMASGLQSPLFRKIREANALSWQHTGGCTLWEHRDEVEALL